jgi:hypothetical protein
MKQLNEYFFIIGILFILFIIILFRTIHYEQLTNTNICSNINNHPECNNNSQCNWIMDPKTNYFNCQKLNCDISNIDDCNLRTPKCSWDNYLNKCKINFCKKHKTDTCKTTPNCKYNMNQNERGCYDISFINCDVYRDSSKCNNNSNCLWDKYNNICKVSKINTTYIEKYIKDCSNSDVRFGNRRVCDLNGCDFRDSKCFPSSCIFINNERECSSKYNCLWNSEQNICAKDLKIPQCKNPSVTQEQCKQYRKCFWNINKKDGKGKPGICDAIDPKDWKP